MMGGDPPHAVLRGLTAAEAGQGSVAFLVGVLLAYGVGECVRGVMWMVGMGEFLFGSEGDGGLEGERLLLCLREVEEGIGTR